MAMKTWQWRWRFDGFPKDVPSVGDRTVEDRGSSKRSTRRSAIGIGVVVLAIFGPLGLFGPFSHYSPAAATPGFASGAQAIAGNSAPSLGPELPVSAPHSSFSSIRDSASDGTNHLVVRQEGNEVVGARVSAEGALLDVNGFVIGDLGVGAGSTPAVAFDGTNYLVVWNRKPVLAQPSIYGVRVSPGGAVIGEPFVITGGSTNKGTPKVGFNGTDFVVAWSVDAKAVVAARVTPAGVVLDPAGIALPAAGRDIEVQGVAFNGSSTLVVWDQTSGGNRQLVATRITSTGVVADPTGIVVASGVSNRVNDVAAVGPNFMVVWSTQPSAETADVRAGRVSPSGALLDGDGIVVANAGGWAEGLNIAFDGTNAHIVWNVYEDDARPIYGARVTPAGAVLDPTARPMVVEDEPYLPLLSSLGTDLLLIWSGDTGGLRGAVLKNGEPPTTDGTVIARENDSRRPDVAFDGTNYLVVWAEPVPYGSTDRIVVSRVSPSGTFLDGQGIIVTTEADRTRKGAASVSFDGTNFLVVWSDVRDDGSSIYGARISRAGGVLDPQGLVISRAASYQVEPAVAFDGANHLVVWQDSLNGDPAIWAKRVAPDGSTTEQLPIAWASGEQTAPDVASDGTTSLIVWEDNRTGNSDINSIRIGRTGGPIGPRGGYADPTGPGVPVSSAPGEQLDPSVAWNGERYLVVWTDRRTGTGDIHASRVTRANAIEDPSGIVVSGAPDDQSDPVTAASGAMFLVVWADRRSGTGLDTYGARVDGRGTVRDQAGFAIAAGPNPESQPAITKGSGSTWNVVWMRGRPAEDSRYGILFMREVSSPK